MNNAELGFAQQHIVSLKELHKSLHLVVGVVRGYRVQKYNALDAGNLHIHAHVSVRTPITELTSHNQFSLSFRRP